MAQAVSIALLAPLLADYPEFVKSVPVEAFTRREGAIGIKDDGADIRVRSWRRSESAPEIIESRNLLRRDRTALIVVHPWGIEDGQGWVTPQANESPGFAFAGLKEDNLFYNRHIEKVIKTLVDRLRKQLPLVLYSLPGAEDGIRHRLYRSITSQPTPIEHEKAQAELEQYLSGLHGKWPDIIPLSSRLRHSPEDVVFYDGDGYASLRDFLRTRGIRHVLLAGYATDMCLRSTTAGYLNLKQDFDVIVVGDATLCAWPLTLKTPNGYQPIPTRDELLNRTSKSVPVTQASWINTLDR